MAHWRRSGSSICCPSCGRARSSDAGSIDADEEDLCEREHLDAAHRGWPSCSSSGCTARSRWSRPTRSMVPVTEPDRSRSCTGLPPAREVAQDERQPEPVGQGRPAHARGPRSPARPSAAGRRRRAAAARPGRRRARSPATQSRPTVRGTTSSTSPSTSRMRSGRGRRHRGDAVAQAPAAETESLLLGVALALLNADAGLELRLEVGEQLVPAHPRNLPTPPCRGGDFSTAAAAPGCWDAPPSVPGRARRRPRRPGRGRGGRARRRLPPGPSGRRRCTWPDRHPTPTLRSRRPTSRRSPIRGRPTQDARCSSPSSTLPPEPRGQATRTRSRSSASGGIRPVGPGRRFGAARHRVRAAREADPALRVGLAARRRRLYESRGFRRGAVLGSATPAAVHGALGQ